MTAYLSQFMAKMEKAGIQPVAMETFRHYYQKVVSGETGMIPDAEIEPLADSDLAHYSELGEFARAGQQAEDKTVMIVLNGGLGTSMGLTGPKSLLAVKGEQSFLAIRVKQAQKARVQLVLMNSFSTHEKTHEALRSIQPAHYPLTFVQHKFPKIVQADLSPATWPADPELEWNPPGHGDIYTALYTSGMLDKLLDQGREYAFISNCDNLGSGVEPSLLGYFAHHRFPFMMEVSRRTPADMKGGHLARHENGRLILRESAQCPEAEMDAFKDISRYRFFNTNNLWINLRYLRELIHEKQIVHLPMILNPKHLDPRDASSPMVYQVETAMGAAISLFEGATAVQVPRSRFFPVKKCNELLALRSDAFVLAEDHTLQLNPRRESPDPPRVKLDERYYKKIDQLNQRFPEGAPSLLDCQALTVQGDIRFEGGVVIKGDVKIDNPDSEQAVVPAGTVVESDRTV